MNKTNNGAVTLVAVLIGATVGPTLVALRPFVEARTPPRPAGRRPP